MNDAKPHEIYISLYGKSMRHCGHVQIHSAMIASGVTIFGGPMFHPTSLSQAFPMVRGDAATQTEATIGVQHWKYEH